MPTSPRQPLIAAIRAYQRTLSPWLGPRCRFHPSCSSYAIEAIQRFGGARGSVLAVFRVARCNPLCEGGVDLVPDIFPRRPWRRAPAQPQATPTDEH